LIVISYTYLSSGFVGLALGKWGPRNVEPSPADALPAGSSAQAEGPRPSDHRAVGGAREV
nr:hypothetical protein [Acidobacteriota bacterium]